VGGQSWPQPPFRRLLQCAEVFSRQFSVISFQVPASAVRELKTDNCNEAVVREFLQRRDSRQQEGIEWRAEWKD
jgi:hypothetical protein